jgi:hypothetical protein
MLSFAGGFVLGVAVKALVAKLRRSKRATKKKGRN